MLSYLKSLELSCEEICLLLWLLYGTENQPLSDKEKKIYFPEVSNFEYEKKIRNDFVFAHQELNNVLASYFNEKWKMNDRSVEVKMFHGVDPVSFIENERRLFNLEKGNGHRLLISKYPSILLSRDPANLAAIHFDKEGISFKIKYENLLKQRISQFDKNVSIYGARCIHSLPSIPRFANQFDERISNETKKLKILDRTEKSNRIKRMIQLLKTEPLFHVALAECEPEWEIMIKSFEAIALRPTSRQVVLGRDPLIYGPTLMYWQNEPLKRIEKTQEIINADSKRVRKMNRLSTSGMSLPLTLILNQLGFRFGSRAEPTVIL